MEMILRIKNKENRAWSIDVLLISLLYFLKKMNNQQPLLIKLAQTKMPFGKWKI